MISPAKITRVFVCSDIVTFLCVIIYLNLPHHSFRTQRNNSIQACGGAISASAKLDRKKNELGSHVCTFYAKLAHRLANL